MISIYLYVHSIKVFVLNVLSVFVFEKGDTVDTDDGALHSVWFFERLPRCNEFNCISAIEPLQLLQQHCRDKADHFHPDPIFWILCVFLILILSIFILKLRWRACVCLTTASAIASLLQRHLDDIVGSNMANIILANINIANITANIVLLDYSYSTQHHIFKGLSVSMHKFNTVLGLPS